MAILSKSAISVPKDLVAALSSLASTDPWTLFQEGYCKTLLMQTLLGQYSFYESSNNHEKFWYISTSGNVLRKKAANITPREKPDIRLIDPTGDVTNIEVKVWPSFGSLAQLATGKLHVDLLQICCYSSHVFLAGLDHVWVRKLSNSMPGLFPASFNNVPTASKQSFTGKKGDTYQLNCWAAQADATSPVAIAWHL